MLRASFIAAALVAALPFAAAAQSPDRPAGPAAAAPAPRAAGPQMPAGGRGGVAVLPGRGIDPGVNTGPTRGYYPQAGWSDPGWRGRHRYHRHHRHVFGPSIFFGSTFAASPYYYDDYYYDEPYVIGGVGASPDEVAYCRRKYKSYDIRTGTYLNRDGNRYPCP